MKKLISIVAVAFLLMSAIVTQAHASGARFTPAKSYIYCRNVSDQTMYDGEVVMWATVETVTGYDVTFNTEATTSLVAGVVADLTLRNDGFGNIQVSGYHAALKVDTVFRPIAIGDCLIPSNSYGFLKSKEDKGSGFFVALEAEVVHEYEPHESSSDSTVKGIIRVMGAEGD